MLLAFALAALTLSGRITVAWILVFAALSGMVNAFDIPTRQAFAVDMVGRDDLINAIALNSSIFNGARVDRAGDRRHRWWRGSARAGASSPTP